MTYIYLDESGDLSFDFTKKGTPKFFIITVLISENKVLLDKLIKKINLEVARMSKGKSTPNMCFMLQNNLKKFVESCSMNLS